jgi:hypothetical protein
VCRDIDCLSDFRKVGVYQIGRVPLFRSAISGMMAQGFRMYRKLLGQAPAACGFANREPFAVRVLAKNVPSFAKRQAAEGAPIRVSLYMRLP